MLRYLLRYARRARVESAVAITDFLLENWHIKISEIIDLLCPEHKCHII